jgi:hypothetical protein
MEFSNSLRRLAMEALKDNTEPYELKSFSRKLNPDDHIKDRMIMRHLKRRKDNSVLDFDESTKVQKNVGARHE